ncbi:DUF3592 domain-containing protein [Arthrobacter sp. BE255]|uniref:DUF3592 domain-containing protein n=1 Tax=Arthrobacter sp. BE255 TaxID=2817721 RepID=UPI0028662C31|nr:DUF3592 domain-containing protein [Arthrobacter sp. BE255]MDR7160574.1 hypothetical protein [Arthrobacter sp. BE255]
MTSPNAAVNRKPKISWGMRANLAFSALVICLGPILIVVGTLQINADAELVRTGEQVPGTVTEFHDRAQASDRKMKVEFQSAAGSAHYEWIMVDYHQHPVVGEEVKVRYRLSDPDEATVVGFESDGVFLRGVGVVLTFIFGGIGILLAISSWMGSRKRRNKPIG